MAKPCGILLFGANGCGKTTLGHVLARNLDCKHMDIETYHFEPSDIPYSTVRSREACLRMMRADMRRHGTFVLSAVTGAFGDDIMAWFGLGIYIEVPRAVRMERVRQRAFVQHGARVLPGGDLYEREEAFWDFAASRDVEDIKRWGNTLACPVMRVNGLVDCDENAAMIAERFMRGLG